ncbi:MAG: molecular chaperone TorD family protein [Pseudomonadales bacterium]|nr:molecular chaperone TorD family protein [Pseudomonadales bacterium]
MTPQRQVRASRQRTRTAPPRCAAYAVCSELVASPDEFDPRTQLRARTSLGNELDYTSALDAMVLEIGTSDLERLRADYSNLFEIGNDGPPLSIREHLARGDHGGTREEVVRYYEHFGYSLGERHAWQPDHLSVQLEFMHFVCFRESQASREAQALPFQLAQIDFTERHLATWLPDLAARVASLAPGSVYGRAVAAVAEFVAADQAWQQTTIEHLT